ncbi:shikimate dehydrogenase [Woeseiaceae bacterium]|jgi:shikimate dehydrogenase|nr:shikimate dehydrogenase [Woeseiaceae bacterium]|tara:strand:- start:1613 stop:2470 length:858 start_codon:yes stop_codon:yes gene_type:complete
MNIIAKEQYGVLGDPISHSQSPAIHNLFASQLHQTINYKAFHVIQNELKKFITEYKKKGGKGLNVTLPHKTAVMEYIDEISPRAAKAGAVNTLIFDENKIIGDNTDGIGLINDLENNFHQNIKNKNILIIGAGGASRGIINPLMEKEPSSLTIANRTASKANQLVSRFQQYLNIDACGIDALKPKQPYDIIINATSSAITSTSIDFPCFIIAKNTICYDLSYGSSPTQFMLWAMENGAECAIQGWGMLIEQAAESYLIWKKIRPDTSAILKQLNINASSQVLRRL